MGRRFAGGQMDKSGRYAFWIFVAISSIIYSVVLNGLFLSFRHVAIGLYHGWPWFQWVLAFGFALPVMSLGSAFWFVPGGLAYAIAMALLSRSATNGAQWILRGGLCGGLSAAIGLILLIAASSTTPNWRFLLFQIIAGGIGAGMFVALVMSRWRPDKLGLEDTGQGSREKTGSLLRPILVYSLLGPLIATPIFTAFMGAMSDKVHEVPVFVAWVKAAMPQYLLFLPMILVHGGATGIVCGLASRRIGSTHRWYLANFLLGGAVASLSVLSWILTQRIVRLEGPWPMGVLLPMGLFVAGAVAALLCGLICDRFKPFRPQSSLEPTHRETQAESETVSKGTEWGRKVRAWVAFILVFALLGPIVGGLVICLGGGIFTGAVASLEDFYFLLVGGLALSLALAPLGMIQAIIAAVISGLVSRATLSTRRWLTYTTALGGAVSAFSLTSILLIYVLADSYGAWAAIGLGLLCSFVAGAVAALVCALICMKFRPRRIRLEDKETAAL